MSYYCGGCGGNAPRGRKSSVYIILAAVAVILGLVNETLGFLFLVFSCYLAWVSS